MSDLKKFVKYISDMGFIDCLTESKTYEVVEEIKGYYVIINDLGLEVEVQNDRFEEV